MNVLFVCLGNICRSPSAQGVLTALAAQRKCDVTAESAGTAAYHIGKAPDPRSQECALRRDVDLSKLKARQVVVSDFYEYDFIFAMDSNNLAHLRELRPSDATASLTLFLQEYGSLGKVNVPDPYYDGAAAFDGVLDLLFDACDRFLDIECKV
jgi:protein-tyrosine phosphatase